MHDLNSTEKSAWKKLIAQSRENPLQFEDFGKEEKKPTDIEERSKGGDRVNNDVKPEILDVGQYKDIRKKQLDLGHVIIDFFQSEKEFEKINEQKKLDISNSKKRGVGRPKKDHNLKARTRSIVISKELYEYVQARPFGRGFSTRMKRIISDYSQDRVLERERIIPIKKILLRIYFEIEKFSKKAFRSERIEDNELVRNEINKKIKDLTLLLGILKIPEKRIRDLLEGDEIKAYEFALYYTSNNRVD